MPSCNTPLDPLEMSSPAYRISAKHDAGKRHFVSVAHDARNLVDHYVVKQAVSGIAHHSLELGTVDVAPRLRIVAVFAHDLQTLALTVCA